MIHHFSFSETGGAGNVASILNSELRLLGVKSMLHSTTHSNLRDDWSAHPNIALRAVLDQNLLTAPSFTNMTSLLRGATGRSNVSKDFSPDRDLLHLHWPWGVLRSNVIDDYLRQGFKVIFTLHDMRALTGFCHFTGGCQGFKSDCSNCPAARSFAQKSVVKSKSQSDRILSHENLYITSPSPNFSREASSMPVLRGKKVMEIVNPVREVFFESRTPAIRDKKRFAFVAADLADPRKGLQRALAFFLSVREPGDSLSLVGHGLRDESLPEGVKYLGPKSPDELSDFFSSVQFLLFFSSDDNAPLVLAEAAVRGVSIVVGRDSSGWEFVDEYVNIIHQEDFRNLRLSTNAPQVALQEKKSIERFKPVEVAKSYLSLYREVLPSAFPKGE
jgi:glycosyltransferase involved in cell wall biosynthesis